MAARAGGLTFAARPRAGRAAEVEEDERHDETAALRGDDDAPHDADAEQPDPESGAASDPPPGQEPGEGKQHDL